MCPEMYLLLECWQRARRAITTDYYMLAGETNGLLDSYGNGYAHSHASQLGRRLVGMGQSAQCVILHVHVYFKTDRPAGIATSGNIQCKLPQQFLFLCVSRPGSEVRVSYRVRGLGTGGEVFLEYFWKHVGGRLCRGVGVVGAGLREQVGTIHMYVYNKGDTMSCVL